MTSAPSRRAPDVVSEEVLAEDRVVSAGSHRRVERVMGGASTLRDEIVRRLEVHDRSDLVSRPLPSPWSLPASHPGVITAVVFGGLTLLPSMLPKNALMQGVVLGVNFIVGYALGVTWQWAWRFLELPSPRGRRWRRVVAAWYVVLGVLLVLSLWHHVGWQNDMRRDFGMPEATPAVWLLVLPIAFVVAVTVLIICRSLRRAFNVVIRWFDRHLPRRLALFLGGAAFGVMIWGLWTQVLVDGFFAAANQVAAPIDASTEAGISRPSSSLRSGSPDSLVDWDTLGRQGRSFVASGPRAEDLEAVHGGGAMEPVRVYVGLRSAPTVQERAELLLDELVRTGAFDRDVLVVAATTGTGLLDPEAMDSVEYLLHGDVAVAGMQYSYLSSAISLLADVDEVRETTHAMFDTIHGHWATLPEDARPAIYLYGLSLGSLGVESILTSIDVVNEPIDGALLVGPTFANQLRTRVIADRDAGTPAAPVYESGMTVRFMNERGVVPGATADWGDTRIMYLQYATDPVVFFSPDLLFREPDWLTPEQRDEELSPDFHWIPIVTMWQVLTDMAVAGSVPRGHGHMYTVEAHVAAWAEIIDEAAPWSEADIDALLRHLAATDTDRQD